MSATRAVVRAVLALSLVALAAPAVSAQTNEALRHQVEEDMKLRLYYTEYTAIAKMSEWGPASVPILIEIIKGDDSEKAVFYLGKSGSHDAVQPIIDHIRNLKPDTPKPRWGYHALGWLGFPEAVDFLLRAAENPVAREEALFGLERVKSRSGIAAIRGATKTVDDALKPELERIADAAEKEANEADTLAAAREKMPLQGPRLQQFWKRQEATPNHNLAKEIVGRFEGRAYSSSWSGSEILDNIFIRFDKNGTFETNLDSLMTGRAPKSLPSGNEVLPHETKYRVLSPTQLVLGAGHRGLSTVAPSLHDGQLSFYHTSANVMVVLQKASAKSVDHYDAKDFSGTYKGKWVPVDRHSASIPPERQSVEAVFSDTGEFVPSWIGTSGKRTPFAHQRFEGRYLLDPTGQLVISISFGGGDYIGGSIIPFFDWYLDGAVLHTTAFDSNGSSHLAMTIDGSPLLLPEPQSATALARGVYRGSAFRAPVNGEIREISDVSIQFYPDGSYHTNWSELLQETGEQYHANNDGYFRLVSPRHLLIDEFWEGQKDPICDATTDLFIDGDILCFTSPRRKAYFVLKRAQDNN